MTEPAPFQRYLDLAPEQNCEIALQIQHEQELPKFQLVSEDQACIVHPPYQWTIKEVVGHLSDTERVFAYRALRFARGDATPLPGFDQDAYMLTANFNDRPYEELVQELNLVRQATVELFRTLPEEAFEREGTASGYQWTVRNLGRCCVGHVRHHLEIVQRRVSSA
ncbi:DinB superfamily protein [Bremerella volcania]|uniref:DinB superfamily protein n=1 Tax=Bremerella volcania TaxID=2527984 RepID=A0A518C9S7_9BACT|nr:DinB family protein [Bremerella volcania]QDU75979.1 DinB superfamily protein [Bremerella volcania]